MAIGVLYAVIWAGLLGGVIERRVVALPEEELDINDPEFAEKAWAFMTATRTPAPFLVIRAPDKKQYPWEWTPAQARGPAASDAERQARAD